jgi:hypothetical protein
VQFEHVHLLLHFANGVGLGCFSSSTSTPFLTHIRSKVSRFTCTLYITSLNIGGEGQPSQCNWPYIWSQHCQSTSAQSQHCVFKTLAHFQACWLLDYKSYKLQHATLTRSCTKTIRYNIKKLHGADEQRMLFQWFDRSYHWIFFVQLQCHVLSLLFREWAIYIYMTWIST